MGGFANGCDWMDESYDELDFDDSRTIAAGMISLGVEVADVIDSSMGIATPPVDPTATPEELKTVGSTSLTFRKASA